MVDADDPDPAPEGLQVLSLPHPDGGSRRAGGSWPSACWSSREAAPLSDATPRAIIPVKRFGAAKQRLLDALDRPAARGAGQGDARRRAGRHRRRRADRADDRRHRRAASGADRAPPGARAPPCRWRSSAIPRTPATRRRRRWGSSAPRRSKPTASPCCPGTVRCSTRQSSTRRSRACGAAGCAIVPDRHGTGTNALCSRRPTRSARPSVPEAAPVTSDRARRAGHEVAVEPLDSLASTSTRPTTLPRSLEALEREPQPGPRDGGRAGARRPAQGRDASVSGAARGRPGARPAGDRRRRPARRADRARLASASVEPAAADIVAVAQKAVSKAEGRVRELDEVVPGREARRSGDAPGQGPAPGAS